jgi:hypothetical protein
MKPLNIISFMLGFLIISSQIHSLQSKEITLDLNYYYYEEPNFMDDTSDPTFISLGIRDWEPKNTTDSKYDFLYTAEVTRGWVSYSSKSTGSGDKDYYKFRGEAYLSFKQKEFTPINGMSLVFAKNFTPIIGLGYRWLYDDSGGMVSSTGHWGYDRKSQYIYIPMGGIYNLNDKLKIKGQFNYLLRGMQDSYLSIKAGYSDSYNEQTSGWGTDFTVDYKIDDKTSIYSFYRYWDIDDSSIAVVAVPGGTSRTQEPANTTTEFGIGVAYKF